MQSWLSWFLRGVLVLLFLILVARLIGLQIIERNYYRTLSEGNRIRRIVLPAPRGKIIARGGEILVGNRPIEKTVAIEPKGEISITKYQRDYILGSRLVHVSGYLGEVGEAEVGKVDPRCPEKGPRKLGDWVGRGGLEEEYDYLLKGIPGEELVEVDIHGRMVRVLGKKEPIPGGDLKTNIDLGLQNKIVEAFGNKKGAVIATDTKGQVLALYSSPSFDPGNVVPSLKDQDLPLFNRVIGGQYHPGSVFKPFVAMAALLEGKIDKNYTFVDPGVITIGKFSYSNWYFSQYGKTEGTIDVTRALARSTDTFFYKLGEIVGIEKIDEWAKSFGLSEKTGIDLPGEVAGLVPTPEWKKKIKEEPWFLGNTYHVAIGQGDLAVTPIEINQAVSTIASGGVLCSPRVVSSGKCKDLNIKKEYLDLVKEGMIKVCSSGGTGYTFFGFTPQVACKTGTAETNEDGKTHAWFTLFAPADLSTQAGFPEIVLTVLVEGGGEGSKIAGPIAREIMDYYIKR